MKVVEIDEKEFEEKVLKSNKKVLVDFYADWCGPCKMLSPVVEKVSLEDDTYLYYKINIDHASDLSKEYKIMSIPLLCIFEQGEIKDRSLGFISLEELKKFLGI